MKFVFVFFVLLNGFLAHSVPVINENVAQFELVTVYPDHQDKHRYYVAPNVVNIAKNDKGIPIFSYNDYRKKLFNIVGSLKMTLKPQFKSDEMRAIEQQILKKDPLAIIVSIPIKASELEMSGQLSEIIDSHSCSHISGNMSQEQSCSIILTSVGRNLFLTSIDRKALFLTLNWIYRFQGFVKLPDGQFALTEIEHGVAAKISGDELSEFPQLLDIMEFN